MVIVIVNGNGERSSNPERGYLHLTALIPIGKVSWSPDELLKLTLVFGKQIINIHLIAQMFFSRAE